MGQVITYLLENYGALGIMLILIGGLAWFIIKELRESNKALIDNQTKLNQDMTTSIAKSMQDLSFKLTDDLREQNKQLIDHIINAECEKERTHQANLLTRRNVTSEINIILNNIRNLFEADRACVLEFHNSFANQTGFPFLKYTVTYEKIAKGCLPIQQQYQAAAFSSISDVAEKILSQPNHIYIMHNIDEVEDVCPIMMTDGRKISGAIWKGIFNASNNLLIGLLCLEYSNKLYEMGDKVELITAARNIGELITLTKPE